MQSTATWSVHCVVWHRFLGSRNSKFPIFSVEHLKYILGCSKFFKNSKIKKLCGASQNVFKMIHRKNGHFELWEHKKLCYTSSHFCSLLEIIFMLVKVGTHYEHQDVTDFASLVIDQLVKFCSQIICLILSGLWEIILYRASQNVFKMIHRKKWTLWIMGTQKAMLYLLTFLFSFGDYFHAGKSWDTLRTPRCYRLCLTCHWPTSKVLFSNNLPYLIRSLGDYTI